MNFEGTRPGNLGVDTNGRLAACPDKPNCVHSQSEERRRAIAPLTYNDYPKAAMQRLQQVVANMRGARIITAGGNYLYAEFRSRVFGFVDDVEFVCDRRAEVIHVRSASRMGHFDLGANRRRVEAIRKAFPSDDLAARSREGLIRR